MRIGAMLAFVCCCCGCAAMHPVKGIPARYVPAELKGPRRSGKKTIDLSLLRQTPPEQYLIDSGDVLGIYIEGILGRREEIPPVHFPLNEDVAPSVGFPVPVRDDGTISIPLCDPIPVRGLTLQQVEAAIRKALTIDHEILQPGLERILVSLQKPRQYSILVIRQEAGSELSISGAPGALNLGALKRGAGRVVSLPAYKNDVLNALAETGGLPGLDAENTIYVFRRQNPAPHAGETTGKLPSGKLPSDPSPEILSPGNAGSSVPAPVEPAIRLQSGRFLGGWGHTQSFACEAPAPCWNEPWGHTPPHVETPLHAGRMDDFSDDSPTIDSSHVVKIPVRLAEGEEPTFREQDIILQDGDVVFIESRETEVFYTGGLLGGGQYTLPRDYDLDVLGAISIAQPAANYNNATRSVGGVSSMNQDVTIGASSVVVLRQMPNGTQLPIAVDLYRALRDPAERIQIQPGDYVILQYTRTEAFAAFIERHLLEGALFSVAGSAVSSGRN